MKSLAKVKEEFTRIQRLGFLKSTRINNRDGGIGNTFEDYLGVIENNLKDPDFEGFEIKTQRFLNTSYITLFSKSPSTPKGANKFLKDNFGEGRRAEFPDLNTLYASIFGHRWSQVYGKYLMKLEVDYKNEILVLIIKDLVNDNILSNNVSWNFNDLKKASCKLDKLMVVNGIPKTIDDFRHYHYNYGKIYMGMNFENFLIQLDKGNIQFDIRIGVHKTGANYGKPHDHGSGFRIKKQNLDFIYNIVEEL